MQAIRTSLRDSVFSSYSLSFLYRLSHSLMHTHTHTHTITTITANTTYLQIFWRRCTPPGPVLSFKFLVVPSVPYFPGISHDPQ
jgi:hypothetical protein